jgi:hypothetical protein
LFLKYITKIGLAGLTESVLITPVFLGSVLESDRGLTAMFGRTSSWILRCLTWDQLGRSDSIWMTVIAIFIFSWLVKSREKMNWKWQNNTTTGMLSLNWSHAFTGLPPSPWLWWLINFFGKHTKEKNILFLAFKPRAFILLELIVT